MILALAGTALAGYLTVDHYGGTSGAWCSINEVVDCERVSASVYAVVLGVPVAAVGLAGFAALFGIAYATMFHARPGLVVRARSATFGLALAGTLFAGYLTYIEIFVIAAICPLCVAAFGVVLAILAVSVAPASPTPSG